MNNYFVSELYQHAKFTAGVLREDIETSLLHEGFLPIHIQEPRNIFQKIGARFGKQSELKTVNSPGLVFFHFPLRSRIIRSIFKRILHKKITTIAYIHDLEGLRDNNISLLNHEMSMIAKADIVIAQNEEMKNIIFYKTGNKNIIELEMYDYLGIAVTAVHRSLSPIISFAGNLAKASFIHQLKQLPTISFNIYGQGLHHISGNNLKSKGVHDPRVLPTQLEGSFGLVWDGDSIETGSGAGKYLQYNIPHKLALYLIAGLPPIVWQRSAMAKWVLEKNIGLAVNSLFELEQKISDLTDMQYQEFRNNMIKIREKMSRGGYMQNAINQVYKIKNNLS